MKAYMRQGDQQGARFSFEDILNEELRLDREEDRKASRGKAR